MIESNVFGEILSGIDYIEREAVYGLVVNESMQIGIVKTPRGNFLPGGGIEDGENHIECLKREFIEETGYEIEVGSYIGRSELYGLTPRRKRYLKMIGYFYVVKLAGTTKDKIEEDHEFIWLDINKAENEMLLEHQSWAIKKMLSQ